MNYTAADMADAAAKGFKDGQASLKPVLEQALDAFAFAYNACESEWVQDEKIDPVMNAIRAHLAGEQQ